MKEERRGNVLIQQVKFTFLNEMTAKVCQLQVNPFSPLINYKRQLENITKIDLYGKRLVFKYVADNKTDSFNIEYLQEIVDKQKCDFKNVVDIQVFYEEIGG